MRRLVALFITLLLPTAAFGVRTKDVGKFLRGFGDGTHWGFIGRRSSTNWGYPAE